MHRSQCPEWYSSRGNTVFNMRFIWSCKRRRCVIPGVCIITILLDELVIIWCNDAMLLALSFPLPRPLPPPSKPPLDFAIHLFVRSQLSPGCSLEAGASQPNRRLAQFRTSFFGCTFLFYLMFYFLCFTILLKISLPRFRWKVIRVSCSFLVVEWSLLPIEEFCLLEYNPM